MATVALNRVTRTVNLAQVVPDAFNFVGAASNWNQGDLLCLDTSTHLIKPLSSAADSQTFLGIAVNTVVNGTLKSSYQGTAVDAAESPVSMSGPCSGVVGKMKLHTGDSVNPGDLMYHSLADDVQTVTVTAPSAASHALGVYQGAAITSAPAGTQVEVQLGHRYPADTLVL